MKYNINIFKTPSYQKIFKEVLKLRHPNLSEEEALKEEVKYLGCLFYSTKNKKKKDCLFHLIRCDENVCWFFDKKEERRWQIWQGRRLMIKLEPLNKDNKYICVGRPITISELVDVLNRKDKFKDDFNSIGEYGYYYQDNAICQMRYFKSQYNGSKMFNPDIVIEFNKSINFLHELEEYTLNEVVDELD
jgi:hypothetical protein